jgi:hypothetical protein
MTSSVLLMLRGVGKVGEHRSEDWEGTVVFPPPFDDEKLPDAIGA